MVLLVRLLFSSFLLSLVGSSPSSVLLGVGVVSAMPRKTAKEKDRAVLINREHNQPPPPKAREDPRVQPHYKTRQCKFFLSGTCSRGVKCMFAHSQDELHASPNLQNTKMCKSFVLTGMCNNPLYCTYAHSEDELVKAVRVVFWDIFWNRVRVGDFSEQVGGGMRKKFVGGGMR